MNDEFACWRPRPAPMLRSLPLIAALLLPGCSTTEVQLRYAPTITAPQASATGDGVSVGPVVDERRESDPNWVGAVRGGYGNPLKVLRASAPASEVVGTALRDALSARGLLKPGQPELRVTIKSLDVDRVARLQARVALQLTVMNRDGAVLYTDSVRLNRVEGNLISFDTGVFAAVEPLRDLLARTLSEAVDQLLDKPGFRRAIGWVPPSA